MTHHARHLVTVECLDDGPGDTGVPILRVLGYAGLGELWLYPVDGWLLSINPGPNGCRPLHPPGWPPLTSIVWAAFPEVLKGVSI